MTISSANSTVGFICGYCVFIQWTNIDFSVYSVSSLLFQSKFYILYIQQPQAGDKEEDRWPGTTPGWRQGLRISGHFRYTYRASETGEEGWAGKM